MEAIRNGLFRVAYSPFCNRLTTRSRLYESIQRIQHCYLDNRNFTFRRNQPFHESFGDVYRDRLSHFIKKRLSMEEIVVKLAFTFRSVLHK